MKESEDKNKKLDRALKEYKEKISDLEREVTCPIHPVTYPLKQTQSPRLFNLLKKIHCILFRTLYSSILLSLLSVLSSSVCGPDVVCRSKRNDRSYVRTKRLIKSSRSTGSKSATNSRNRPLRYVLRWTTWNPPSPSKTRRSKIWCITKHLHSSLYSLFACTRFRLTDTHFQ